jgi:arylsulfatase A-like enzyme
MIRLLLCLILLCSGTLTAADRPNILLIYADDLGYGDVSCNGAATIATPNIDRLAQGGLRFTDGHSASATCTPSRYALLTGEYAFRKKGTGILPGDAPLIIEPGRVTLPAVLKKAGYRTGVVGKWHLGLGTGDTDWNGEIKPGPLEVGFDESFIMAATGDRVPCVYVKDHRVVNLDPQDPIEVNYKTPYPGLPTGKGNPELLRMHPSHGHDMAIVDGISRIGYMKGGKAALWKDEEMADTFTREAVAFMGRNKDQGAPFFLFFASHDPHVPRVPHPRYVGKSGMGPRGDAILQFDDDVGTVLDALERFGLANNTLVILTSDNGPVVDDGYKDDAVEKLGAHKPAGPWRGGKYSAFEGGTRVPFIVRWPGRVKPGVSGALVCQVDLTASLAELTGQAFDKATAPDSVNVLPALLGESTKGRDELVEHAGALSLRQGNWKYIQPAQGPARSKNTAIETGADPAGQLYELAADPGETRNLVNSDAARAQAMAARLKQVLGDLPKNSKRGSK